jgi:hypothetical protein
MKTKWIVAFALALVVNGLTGGVTIAQTQHNNVTTRCRSLRTRRSITNRLWSHTLG